jgi:hypothetical protein
VERSSTASSTSPAPFWTALLPLLAASRPAKAVPQAAVMVNLPWRRYGTGRLTVGPTRRGDPGSPTVQV